MFRVIDIFEGQKGDQGGGPKMAKILGGVKFQHFGPPLWPKKCFKQLKKWCRPKIDEKIGWGKTRKSLRGRPKKGQNSIWGKTGHL